MNGEQQTVISDQAGDRFQVSGVRFRRRTDPSEALWRLRVSGEDWRVNGVEG